MFDAKRIKDKLVLWIQNWFACNGPDCKAIIGISGGKDSTVAAALCVEALGADRVIGVLMPNGEQSDIADSYEVVKNLGIEFFEADIEDSVYAVCHSILRNKRGFKFSDQTMINISPRIRMTTLYAISQSVNGRVVCTDNLSESYVGYSTRWGDGVGDFCPLLNLTSDEVMAIGNELGLPKHLVYKTPSDGLCGKTDEDNFGFTYEVLNKYIRTGICENEEIKKRIDWLYVKNRFKQLPIPAFQYP